MPVPLSASSSTLHPWRRRAVAVLAPIVGLVFVSWMQTFLGAAAVVAVPACNTTDATGITPITGIQILSSTLTAGRGCGTEPGQVYKYVSIVTIPAGVPQSGAYVVGGITDCFAEATFNDLCEYPLPDAAGASTFDVAIFAFTKAQWDATVDGGQDQTSAILAANGIATPLLNTNNACVGARQTGVLPIVTALSSQATWITQCTATQQSDIPVIANCAPLEPAPQ